MPIATAEKSSLKRARVGSPAQDPYETDETEEDPDLLLPIAADRTYQGTQGEETDDAKKPRRSERVASQKQTNDDLDLAPPTPASKKKKDNATTAKNSQLPSPVTRDDSTMTNRTKDRTQSPPPARNDISTRQQTPEASAKLFSQNGLNSPPSDTQPFSQFTYPPKGLSHEVEDEEGEGVWGYLLPVGGDTGGDLVLRRRTACPLPQANLVKGSKNSSTSKKSKYQKQEERFEETKIKGISSSGYLIGRHPECDRVLKAPTISNRHCIIFAENHAGHTTAVLEDLSGNGTFINDCIVGRNKQRVLNDCDQISILNEARFAFRYPRSRTSNGFNSQFAIANQLGKGHFATVYLAVERSTGNRFAVKKFEKRAGTAQKSMVEGLRQEIAVLMGVSHPNVLCLKDTFEETDGVYLVLELAPEGELFNWIVMNSKLSEKDTRKVFIQLFQGLKYLHERNIVHRDIKPENILLTDKDLNVKLADFGLAKIIGEESFTTTLCGTPSYVAPEILEQSNHRRYTRAVDVWSLGVVLYICLCGFPPFSDELYSQENPYNLSQQIKMGRFDYPSPYWDPVSDLALDLIDRMLTVDVEKRISIDECLQHPWTTQRNVEPNDSTEGLTGAMGHLDFSKRKIQRERTLISAVNDVRVSRMVPLSEGDAPRVKVFEKNKSAKHQQKVRAAAANGQAVGGQNPQEFMGVGDGRQPLFGDDAGSVYPGSASAATRT